MRAQGRDGEGATTAERVQGNLYVYVSREERERKRNKAGTDLHNFDPVDYLQNIILMIDVSVQCCNDDNFVFIFVARIVFVPFMELAI